MSSEIQAFAIGFPEALIHAGCSFALLVAACALYVGLSPYKEIQQIREGNAAAAISFGGVIVGLAAPLAVSMNASTSALEVVVWGVAVVFLQLLTFRIIDVLLSGLPQRAQDGDVAAASLLVAAKLSAALILSAAVAG